MLIRDGVATSEDLVRIMPSDSRFAEGAVAVVECFQEIPCNPCVKACKRGAISMSGGINGVPVLDAELCNGCGVCISLCPGLAIFVVDLSYSDDFAVLKLPYEYVPVPKVGQFVIGLNRAGEESGIFEVVRVTSGGKKNMTYTVSLAVAKELAMEIRDIQVES